MDALTLQLTKNALNGAAGPKPAATKPNNYSIERSGFGKTLDNQVEANNSTTDKLLQFVNNMTGGPVDQNMNAIPAGEIKVDLAKAGEINGSTTDKKSAIFDIFKDFNQTQNNMDQLLEQMSTGKKFNTHELLRLQVFAHQHSVTYEMVSKFGEMGNRAIQTPFQMQV